LNYFETRDSQNEDDRKVDQIAIRQGLTTSLLNQQYYPVRREIQAYGDDGE